MVEVWWTWGSGGNGSGGSGVEIWGSGWSRGDENKEYGFKQVGYTVVGVCKCGEWGFKVGGV